MGPQFERQRDVRARVRALVGFLFLLLFAGCASVPPATPSATRSTVKIASKAAGVGVKAPANTPASSASQIPKKDSIASELTKQKTSPSLDLTSLEKRLKETHAIDVLDKIAFRNAVDDLLSQFRAYYQGTLKTSLSDLRRPYDLLVLELLSLLQDKDPSLAAAVVASREAIWVILADPAKFATI